MNAHRRAYCRERFGPMAREGGRSAAAWRLARRTMSLALLAIALWPPLDARAETFPSRPIRIIVGQTPGNSPDTLARMVADPLSILLRTPVTVENRSGASGTIAADLVARAPADGYTVLMGGLSNLITAGLLQAGVPYDPVRDFAPIGRIAYTPFVLVAATNLPVTNIPELLAYAKSRPGSVTLGTFGEGSLGRLIYEMLRATAGVELLQVPYKGVGAAVADLIAGRLDLNLNDFENASPHERTGRLRILAAVGSRRAPGADNVPTVAEQGIAGFAIDAWYGLLAPAGTPPDVIDKLAAALDKVRRAPAFRQRLDELHDIPIDDTPAEFSAALRSDSARFTDMVRRAQRDAPPAGARKN
jgi:tripartite-type tricarboxylate transporter receptor subunit TctC